MSSEVTAAILGAATGLPGRTGERMAWPITVGAAAEAPLTIAGADGPIAATSCPRFALA